MPRWLKICIKISVAFIGLVVFFWSGVAVYVSLNNKILLKEITMQLNENIVGTLTIESMEPTLIQSLPGISLSLKNVAIHDSLYDVHHHDLLKAKTIDVSINAFSVLSGTPTIRNIQISDGSIYIFTDSSGYSNAEILRKNERVGPAHKTKPRINHVFLKNIDLTFEHKTKFKLFKMDIDKMETIIHYIDTGWTATLNLKTLIKSFAFNTTKGSFLKNKQLSMNIGIGYNKKKQLLSIPDQPIYVGKDQVTIGGRFLLEKTPTAFELDIKAKSILLKNAKELLSPSISSKLDIIDIKKPLDVKANLRGYMKFRDTPAVYVSWVVKDNILVTPAGEIADCSFEGRFINHVAAAKGHNDRNSRISLFRLKGNWEQIAFKADTVRVSNLVQPVIEGRFESQFSLTKLNPVIGGDVFAFNSGTASLNLLYKGGILPEDTTIPYVYGDVQINNGSMTYLPRNLAFTNTSASISFRGSDVYIKNVKVRSGTNTLLMNGSVLNFLNLYYSDPTKIVFDWNIQSPQINLNEFRAFLTPKKTAHTADNNLDKHNKTRQLSQQLGQMLEVSSVHMKLDVQKILYKAFNADHLSADVQLNQSNIVLNNISINHAGGKLDLRGNLDQSGAINSFHIVSNINNVYVPAFFKSFENFGQKAITDKNLRGRLHARVDVTGKVNTEGVLLPKSFNGGAEFALMDGALIDFEPLQKIGKFVFRNRNLSNVTFSTIKSKVFIEGDKFIISPFLLESSALNMQIGGVYALSKGTDIDIDIPLRNPKRDEVLLDDSLNLKRSMKGIVIHLKAVDGDDGNVQIKLMRKKQSSDGNKRKD